MGAGRPRAFVAVSRVAPDIVTVSLVRQDRRPCRRSKISAGLPSRTRGRAHSRSLITNSLVTPSPNVGPAAHKPTVLGALALCITSDRPADWLSQKRKNLRSRTRGRRVLTATHRRRILRRDCSRQLLVAPPKSAPAAAQASSHFLADDRPAELLAVPTYPVDRGLRGAPHPGVARLGGAARGGAAAPTD